MKALETKIPPPFVALFFVLLLYLFRNTGPSFSFAYQSSIALVFLICGFSIVISAVLIFKREKTTINPLKPENSTALVVKGIFKFTRNPMYLGLLILLLAFSLFLGTFSALIFLPLFILYINQFQILPEERAMKELYGDEFEAYCSKVRRWI